MKFVRVCLLVLVGGFSANVFAQRVNKFEVQSPQDSTNVGIADFEVTGITLYPGVLDYIRAYADKVDCPEDGVVQADGQFVISCQCTEEQTNFTLKVERSYNNGGRVTTVAVTGLSCTESIINPNEPPIRP